MNFLGQFILGLLASVVSVLVLKEIILGFEWLKKHISERLKEKEKHKVAFVSMKDAVDDIIRKKIEEAEEISMEELERMCEETPYVSCLVDSETGAISDYEGIKAEKEDAKLKAKMASERGVLIFG